MQGRRIATNQSTPWAGIEERVNIYASMLWLTVLAGAFLREGSIVQNNSRQQTQTLSKVVQ